ncbi:MAG: aminotransferase class V-fold PLP-dependent enzyme [Gammaproteobacteria bacterium]|nr:aminotransferase class V-fold PLP-dependent enzyme [Gammaproteobacteria bacterium]
MEPIYLDYMATTPIDSRVFQAMLPYLTERKWCANASSIHHAMGQATLKAIEEHRLSICNALNIRSEEFIFTSGATESNNIAILGAARAYQRQGRHLITIKTEHSAVLQVFEHLEHEGFHVTYLDVNPNGLIDILALEEAIRPDTILVSVMHVNNEIGVIQDIASIGALLRSKGILFHVDAAQSLGPLVIDLSKLAVDLMSFSAHKIYGPKGIGGLFIRRKPRIQLSPIIYGGGQEQSIRPGTLPTAQIVGFAEAVRIAFELRESEQLRLYDFRQQIYQATKVMDNVLWNGDMEQRIAGNLNMSFIGVDGSDLISTLYPLMVSSQSACSASLGKVSHVLQALGRSEALARSTIRLSLGRWTAQDEVNQAIEILTRKVGKY